MKNEYSYELNLKVREIIGLIIDELSIRYDNFPIDKLKQKTPFILKVLNKLIEFILIPAKYLKNEKDCLKAIFYLSFTFTIVLIPVIYVTSVINHPIIIGELYTEQIYSYLVYMPITLVTALVIGFVSTIVILLAYLIILSALLIIRYLSIYIYTLIYYIYKKKIINFRSDSKTIEIIGKKGKLKGKIIHFEKKKKFSLMVIESLEYGISIIAIRNKDIYNDKELKSLLDRLELL